MTNRAILATYLLILIISIFFVLYEIAGYIGTDYIMSNDENLSEEKSESSNTLRSTFSVVTFGLSFLFFIG